jgi:hypothetical protein
MSNLEKAKKRYASFSYGVGLKRWIVANEIAHYGLVHYGLVSEMNRAGYNASAVRRANKAYWQRWNEIKRYWKHYIYNKLNSEQRPLVQYAYIDLYAFIENHAPEAYKELIHDILKVTYADDGRDNFYDRVIEPYRERSRFQWKRHYSKVLKGLLPNLSR